MKRVIAIALMAIFSTVMFAQTKTETKPVTPTTKTTHKKKSHLTEAKAPATKTETTAPAKKAATTAPAKK